MKILKTGVIYFVIVFGAGFLLGAVRTLWLVPRLGTRMAELMEAPVMFAVTVVAARWIVRRFGPLFSTWSRLGIGLIALGLMLAVELTLVLWLRGISIAEYTASRDPVSGTVYYALLVIFAIMPLLVRRK